MTPEERRARLRQRTQQSVQDKGMRGLGKGISLPLDLTKTNGKDVVWFELLKSEGDYTNLFDIIPFEITRPEYAKMHQFSGRLINRQVGDWDYKLEICVHKSVGTSQVPMLCLREMFGSKCPVCEDMFAEFRKRGTPDFNEKTAKSLQPQWRCVYIVYDYRDEKYDGFKLWNVAYKTFEEYLMGKAENSSEGVIVFSDPFDGRVIEVEGKPKTIERNTFIEPAGLKFLPRSQPYTEEDVVNNFPLDQMLIIPTYEEVARTHLGMEESAPVEQQQECSAPLRTEGRRRQAAPAAPKELRCPNDKYLIGQAHFTIPDCDRCPEENFVYCETLFKEKYQQDPEPEPEQTPEPPPPTPPVDQGTSQRRRGTPSSAQPAPTVPASSPGPVRRSRR